MAEANLSGVRRSQTGKGPAGRFRREGLVPAVLYGLDEGSVPIIVPGRDLGHILSTGANTLITLKIDGDDQLVLTRQVQRHPVKGTLMHVDFVRVRADQTIHADIPVQLIGEAEGARDGGLLEQMLHSVSVEALPADVPGSIEYDVSALDIGDTIYVRDLTVPAGVEIRNEADQMVAQVSAPRIAEPGEEGAPVEGVEGEVVEGDEGAAAAASEESQ